MPPEGPDASNDMDNRALAAGWNPAEFSPFESTKSSVPSLASRVLAEITRLSGYAACQGCGGLLESPALLGGCAHSVCAACTRRVGASRDPVCPVRGCALPLSPRDITPDTTTSHTVECVRLLEEAASELVDVVKKLPHSELLNDVAGAEEDWLGEHALERKDGSPDDAMTQLPRPRSHVAEIASNVDDMLVVCLSKLSSGVRRKCESICRQFGIEYVLEFANEALSPTLVVTELESRSSDSSEGPQAREISFSILFAMIRKLPIVSPEWLFSCDEQGRIMARDQFMASMSYAAHSRPVFDGVVACFDDEFENHEKRVKSDVARLILEGGGKVVDSVQELGASGDQFRLRLVVVLDSWTRVQTDEENVATSDRFKTVDFAWLSGCVTSGVCPPESRHIFETCLTYSQS